VVRQYNQEIEDALRKERWTLHGPNRLVKVVSGSSTSTQTIGGVAAASR